MTARTAVRAGSTLSRSSSSKPQVQTISRRFNSSSTNPESGPSSPSSSSTLAFQPVLPQGQNPAYDAALSYLSSHRSRLQDQIIKLRSANNTSPDEIERLEIAALVNDPATRRAFRDTQGKGQMEQAIMRHLAERAWVKEGGLDLLMQRVYQMGVVPDLLPELGATSPLTVKLGEEIVQPGTIQSPSKWSEAPSATLQLFHHPSIEADQTGLYTLLVLDADHPSPSTQTYAQNLLYAKSDIALSVQSGETNLFTSPGEIILDWQPLLPEKGTGNHRYVFLVLRQSSKGGLASITDRSTFNLRSYLTDNGLSAADVQGISLIRSHYSKEESRYLEEKYREVHGREMIEYGKSPKEMRYGYPLSASEQRREGRRQEAWGRAVSKLQAGLGDLEVTKQ